MGAENAVMDKRPVLQPRKQIATFLVFVCFFAVLLIPIKTPLNRYDEGFAVFGAARVLRGDLPYKDFWTIYPPGQFYATSFFFMLFGEDLLVSRILDTLIRLGITVAIYLLAKKTVSHGWRCWDAALP